MDSKEKKLMHPHVCRPPLLTDSFD
jgi:hypothetical protein